MIAGLVVILIAVLVLPFLVKKVEHNLELFLLAMGLAAAIVSGTLDRVLVHHALVEPVPISAAVLVAGALFKLARHKLREAIGWSLRHIPLRLLVFVLVAALALFSSLITAIIASLVLVEVVGALRLDRKSEVWLTVMACFAIGLGAALTPIGEPLSTLVIATLNQDFWYLARLLWWLVVPGVLVTAALAAVRGEKAGEGLAAADVLETWNAVLLRTGKVFVFVAALVLLGNGFKPIVDGYIIQLPGPALYWINMVSAILDNATLAAAEISPAMGESQIRDVLMSLLLSGGMLIPGNIPNIISASKLSITSTEWARVGVPVGLALMLACFGVLLLV